MRIRFSLYFHPLLRLRVRRLDRLDLIRAQILRVSHRVHFTNGDFVTELVRSFGLEFGLSLVSKCVLFLEVEVGALGVWLPVVFRCVVSYFLKGAVVSGLVEVGLGGFVAVVEGVHRCACLRALHHVRESALLPRTPVLVGLVRQNFTQLLLAFAEVRGSFGSLFNNLALGDDYLLRG